MSERKVKKAITNSTELVCDEDICVRRILPHPGKRLLRNSAWVTHARQCDRTRTLDPIAGLNWRLLYHYESSVRFKKDRIQWNDHETEIAWRTRLDVELPDQKMQVVSRDGLAAMKRLAGRAQDLLDLEKLGISE